MAESFTYKLTTESELFTFDFSQTLNAAEVIEASICTVAVMSGTDLNPNNILVGAPTYTNKTASQRVANGLSEVTYRLIMTVFTSEGNTFVGVGDLSVYDPTLV